MRILILSVTAGQGHNRTAKGIAGIAQSRGHECKIVDTFEYVSPAMGELVDEGYRLSIAFTPKAFGRALSKLRTGRNRSTPRCCAPTRSSAPA